MASPLYDERLGVPLRWWVQGTMLLASLWLAVVVALPPAAAWAATIVGGALMSALLISYGRARIVVAAGPDGPELFAGRARVALRHLGAAKALDREATRLAAGREADARAFLLLRPYLSRSVRVEVRDAADPTPYWLLSTRHPRELAAVLADAHQRRG